MTAKDLSTDDDLMADTEAAFLAGEVAMAVVKGSLGRRDLVPIDHAALYRHATRRPGEPVDFATARLLKTNETARTMLARMIAARALAVSPMAWAAADSSATSRRIGACRLDVDPPAAEGMAAMTIDVSEAARAPTVLRAEWDGRSVVLGLPPADDGLIELFFSETAPEHLDILRVLREPTALIALE